LSIFSLLWFGSASHVEVGVEHPHLSDLVDGRFVAARALADRLRGGCVEAEGGAFVLTDVAEHPGEPVLGVSLDHPAAKLSSGVCDRDTPSFGEAALHDVSGASESSSFVRLIRPP
jgi:hypothetical protein